jgi:hypothetical protein
MLINKLKLVLEVVVLADIIALIFWYPTIYLVISTDGWSTYNVIELVSELTH